MASSVRVCEREGLAERAKYIHGSKGVVCEAGEGNGNPCPGDSVWPVSTTFHEQSADKQGTYYLCCGVEAEGGQRVAVSVHDNNIMCVSDAVHDGT